MSELITCAFHFGTNILSMKFHIKIGLVLPIFIHGFWKFQISKWIATLKGNFFALPIRFYQ